MRASHGPYGVRGRGPVAVHRSYHPVHRSIVSRTYVTRPYVSRTYVTRPHVGTIYAQRRHGGISRGRYHRPHVRYYPHYPRTFVGLGFGHPYGYWANPFYGSLFYPSWYGPWGWGGYGGYYGPGPYGPYGYGRWSEYADDQGGIRLQVNPKKATVYVDGYFVGEVDDFDGSSQRLTLDTGVHKIEVRAPGFETLAIDINILRQETIRYRGALRPINP